MWLYFAVKKNTLQNGYFVRENKLKRGIMSKARLTPRRIEILKLIAKGYSDEEIAEKMNMHISNVKLQLSRANNYFGTRNRHDAVFVAMQKGYINPEDLQDNKKGG